MDNCFTTLQNSNSKASTMSGLQGWDSFQKIESMDNCFTTLQNSKSKASATSALHGWDSFHNIESADNAFFREHSSAKASARMSLATAKWSAKLQQLVTHVPDLIVNRLMDSEMEPPTLEKNYGVLVFADVSGNYMIYMRGGALICA